MVCGAMAGAACKCASDAMPAGEDVGYMANTLDNRADKIAGREYA